MGAAVLAEITAGNDVSADTLQEKYGLPDLGRATGGIFLTLARESVIKRIRNWRRGGLLPNTKRPTARMHLYLRADLRRVMRGLRYKNRGVDYRALRAYLDQSLV